MKHPQPSNAASVEPTHTPSTEKPLVSVCMPVYNDAQFVAQSLQSILNQTYTNLEIQIGDDASTDGTADIVRAFTDPRIRYHRNPANLGQFDNVNAIVRRATGKYVAIYHADDVYTPTIVEKEVAFLETHPEAGAVFARSWRIDVAGRVLGENVFPGDLRGDQFLSLREVLPVLMRFKNWLICTPTFMGRRDVFRKIGYFTSEYSIVSDLEMWLRILAEFRAGFLDQPLMYYRRSGTQVSTGYNLLRTFEDHFFPLMDLYLSRHAHSYQPDSEELTEYSFHRRDDETFRAANHILRGELSEARSLLGRSFPWRTFGVSFRRRKLRVVLLRWLLGAALALGLTRPLRPLLLWFEYPGVRLSQVHAHSR